MHFLLGFAAAYDTIPIRHFIYIPFNATAGFRYRKPNFYDLSRSSVIPISKYEMFNVVAQQLGTVCVCVCVSNNNTYRFGAKLCALNC